MPTTSPSQHLIASAYIRPSLLDPDNLARLGEALLHAHQDSGAYLEVSRDEDSATRIRIASASDLAAAIQATAPPQFGMGSAVAKLQPLGASIFIDYSRKTVPLTGNDVGIEILADQWKAPFPSSLWLQLVLSALVRSLPTRYAYACESAEFAANNILKDSLGVSAIGVNFNRALPGLYWLNYFGAECAQYLKTPPADPAATPAVWHEPPGFFLRLAADPTEWTSEDYGERRARAIEFLGSRYFFKRSAPDQPTFGIPFSP